MNTYYAHSCIMMFIPFVLAPNMYMRTCTCAHGAYACRHANTSSMPMHVIDASSSKHTDACGAILHCWAVIWP